MKSFYENTKSFFAYFIVNSQTKKTTTEKSISIAVYYKIHLSMVNYCAEP